MEGPLEVQTEPMATAYWINTFTAIHDEAKLARYIELSGPAIRAAGGRFLARGNPAHAFEGATTLRTTLIQFDSVEAAVAAYHSPGLPGGSAFLSRTLLRTARRGTQRTRGPLFPVTLPPSPTTLLTPEFQQ